MGWRTFPSKASLGTGRVFVIDNWSGVRRAQGSQNRLNGRMLLLVSPTEMADAKRSSMSLKVLMWTLAAMLLVGGITAVDVLSERHEEGTPFIVSDGPVTEEQVRQKMAADGWSNVLIAREGRYFQVMGTKDQQTRHLSINLQNGHLSHGEDDD
jgi:hypothetical protein